MATQRKATASASTSVATIPMTNSPVAIALGQINEQLSKLKGLTESKYKTGKRLAGFSKPIDEVTEHDEIIKMVSVVVAKEKAYNEAQQALGIEKAKVFKLDGSTAEEWIEDAKLRLQWIEYKDRYDELTTLKKEYEAIMDKEDRKALLDQKLQKLVGADAPAIEA
jgi:hypothetical protein